MIKEFKLQDPGEGIHEVEVQEILVQPGDKVSDGDTAFVVESDKAAIELPSPHDGVVKEIAVGVGDTVKVGDVLMRVDTAADAGQAAAEPAPEARAEPPDAAETADAPEPREEPVPEPAAPPPSASPGRAEEPVKAAPTARKLAKERGIDIAQIPPTGSKGHITRTDVERFASAGGRAAAATGTRPAPEPLPDFAQFGPVEHVPLKSVRKAAAEHLGQAWSEIPHAMVEDKFDLTEVERFRRKNAARVASQGGRLTRTAIMLKAAIMTLQQHPGFNASLDMARGEIIEKRYFNIGVAVDSPRGLIVPVIRNADRLSLFDLSVKLRDLADRARAGRASPEDLKGGSFTLTNIGALGGGGFFPIINHPEVAIMGVGRGRLEPVINGDLEHYHVEARYMVPVSISFDHRLIDGADAARFLNTLRKLLTDPDQFALHG